MSHYEFGVDQEAFAAQLRMIAGQIESGKAFVKQAFESVDYSNKEWTERRLDFSYNGSGPKSTLPF